MSRNSSKKKIPNRRLLALSISLSVIIIFGFLAYKMIFQNQETKFSLNAAIVDQLSEHFSNATFITRATNLLTNAGFNVSYFNSTNVTVPFYRELIEGDYGIIIFRAHSAMRVNATIVDLFTSEKYRQGAYPEYSDLLSIAKYLVPWLPGANESYFAITPSFIEKFGHFPHSIIIAMGCSSLNVSGMAEAFISRGAKAYVGWTNIVLPNDTDHETAKFLDMFLGKNGTLANSIEATYPPHNYYDSDRGIRVLSRMDFYPVSRPLGDLKISDLIGEAKNSKASMTSNYFEGFSFLITRVNFKSKDFLMD